MQIKKFHCNSRKIPSALGYAAIFLKVQSGVQTPPFFLLLKKDRGWLSFTLGQFRLGCIGYRVALQG